MIRYTMMGLPVLLLLVIVVMLPAMTVALTTRTTSQAALKANSYQNKNDNNNNIHEFHVAETKSSSTTPTSTTVFPNSNNNNSRSPPGSPLNMICDEQHEWEMNLGRAVDTLKHDYPYLLTEPPDFSVYAVDLEVVDPSGVTLHGLQNYKNAFRLVHTVVNLCYCPQQSLLTFNTCYDWARNEIRVGWNAHVVPKPIFGGTKTTLHVDGISVYVLDRHSGKIIQHRIEHLLINDTPVRPKRGVLHALQKEVIDPIGGDGGSGGSNIPVFNTGNINHFPITISQFQQSIHPFSTITTKSSSSSLFSMSAFKDGNNNNNNKNNMDWDAFERKNASRKKFGLEPLTPDEYEEIEDQVQELVQQQQQQHQQQQATSASVTTPVPEKKENFLSKLFGNVLEDTCESNYDCTRPQVCCDFGFTKKCCTSGMLVGNDHGLLQKDKYQRATVPVVAGYPPGMGPNDEPRHYIK